MEWLLYSGVSHHITTYLANLSLHSPYTGSNSVLVGDGKSLPIAHAGTLSISQSGSLTFSNTLHVPNMSRSLIYVSCLCSKNDVYIVFSSSDFQVKDQRTENVRLRGVHVNGLYCWPSSSVTNLAAITFIR